MSCRLFLLFLSACLLRCAGFGATYYVSPGGNDAATGTSLLHPFATIQHASDLATAGSTIILMDGTFVDPGDYNVSLKVPLTLRSLNGSSKTRIDGIGQHNGLYLPQSLPVGSISISGITFQNCLTNDEGGAINIYSLVTVSISDCSFLNNVAKVLNIGRAEGGAIKANGPTLTIKNCLFQGNHADDFGGAIAMQECKLTVLNTRFYDNSAYFGGVVSMDSLTTVSMTGCDIVRNYGYSTSVIDSSKTPNNSISLTNCNLIDNRTGLLNAANCQFGCPAYLVGCKFRDNKMSPAIEIDNGGLISQCTFSGNTMPYDISGYPGAAILARSPDSQLNISNCAFLANTFPAGAVYTENTGVNVSFSTFYGNEAWSTTCSAGVTNAKGGGLSVYGCVFWDNNLNNPDHDNPSDIVTTDGGITNIVLTDSINAPAGTDGNKFTDPIFVNPGNLDVHLKTTSPLIGAGGSVGNGRTPYDLDGRPRHPNVCMGCYETPNWDPVSTASGPNGNRRVLFNDDKGQTWLWTITPSGALSASYYATPTGSAANQVLVGSDNKAYLLFTHTADSGITVWGIPTSGAKTTATYTPKVAGFHFKTASIDSKNGLHLSFSNNVGAILIMDAPTTGTTTTTVYGPYLG